MKKQPETEALERIIAPTIDRQCFERGAARKLVTLLYLYAGEARAAQRSAKNDRELMMHAYAANRLEAVLLAVGLPETREK